MSKSPHADRKARKPSFPHRNLPLLLLHAREGVLMRFRPALKSHGLTEQQWRILRALGEFGPLEPRQIVRRCGISSPSLAGILARMEDLGLVQRERLDYDQRRLIVRPTTRGRSLTRQMAALVSTEYQAIETALGTELLTTLHQTLDAVVARLGVDTGAADDARSTPTRDQNAC
ncbi:MAG: homoprotocatechuate degradation operon regulator HpaR [Burkholderiaceae bacterium]